MHTVAKAAATHIVAKAAVAAKAAIPVSVAGKNRVRAYS